MKLNDAAKKQVTTMLELGQVPMLFGEPGIGKSSWVASIARDMNAKYFCLACNQLATKEDLTGARLVPIEKADGTQTYMQMFFPHAVLTKTILYANEHPTERVLLFFDELNRTTPDVTSELLSIPTMRSLGDWDLPDNILIIAAGNDNGNVTPLDEASISRFVKLDVEPSCDVFMTVNDTLNKYIKETLNKHPDLIFGKRIVEKTDKDDTSVQYDEFSQSDLESLLDDSGTDQITTPRTLSMLSDFLNQLSDDEILTMLSDTTMTATGEMSALQEIIEGYTGHTMFTVSLLAVIADTVTRAQNAPKTSVVKPIFFENLKKLTTITELDDAIAGLSETDASAALLYACFDQRDNASLINRLAQKVSHFATADSALLVAGCADQSFNMANVNAFLTSDTAIGAAYAKILGM